LAPRVQQQYPKEDADMGATVSPLADYGMKGIRTTMLTLFAAVAFVLLIACVNVANLLLASCAARQKEFAIRRALGAAGWRIARPLLTESVLLSLVGGVAGLVVAAWSTRLLFYIFKLGALYLPMRPVDSITMDGRVFAFALVASALTGILVRHRPGLERFAQQRE
jgi:putative ABC transport system permease protein